MPLWPASEREAWENGIAIWRHRLGAAGFVAAWEAGRRLAPAEAIAEAIAGIAPTGPAATATATGVKLTRRERQILLLLVEGRSDREIAERFTLSPRTVSNHVSRLLAKIDVASRTAAATYAVRHGLV